VTIDARYRPGSDVWPANVVTTQGWRQAMRRPHVAADVCDRCGLGHALPADHDWHERQYIDGDKYPLERECWCSGLCWARFYGDRCHL
jgi:hypothetical protein